MYTKYNKIVMATDGGVDGTSGTFGISISNSMIDVATNKGKLYAQQFYQSSFRSELYAVLAGLVSIEVFQEYFEINTSMIKTIIILCDNKTAVDRIRQRRKTRRTNNQHVLPDVGIEVQLLEV